MCLAENAAKVGSPGKQGYATALLLQEMAEALTALGNYLAAAHRRSEDKREPPAELREILAKSLDQYERACEALRQLNRTYRRERACDDDRQGFL